MKSLVAFGMLMLGALSSEIAHATVVDQFQCTFQLQGSDGNPSFTTDVDLSIPRLNLSAQPGAGLYFTTSSAQAKTFVPQGNHGVGLNLDISFQHVIKETANHESKAFQSGVCITLDSTVCNGDECGGVQQVACESGTSLFGPNWDPETDSFWKPVEMVNGTPRFDPSDLRPFEAKWKDLGTVGLRCIYKGTLF